MKEISDDNLDKMASNQPDYKCLSDGDTERNVVSVTSKRKNV